MPVSIEFTTNLNLNNKNIVIFVSSLSQLKNIDILPNIKPYFSDKQFVNQIKLNKYAFILNAKHKNNSFINVIISLVETNSDFNIELGSLIKNKTSFFPDKNFNNLVFFFSKTLLKNFKKVVSDIILGFCIKSYTFDKYKTIDDFKNDIVLTLNATSEFKEIKYNHNLLESINFTKNLVSEPANILNPLSYAKKCIELRKIGLKIKVLNKGELKKIGMNSLLGVAKGSENEPCVVIFEWNIKKNKKPTILVGKGVTFDTGGISLKPSMGMEEMFTDMGGSAVVVGSMMNAALNKSKQSLVGIIGLVENMPDGKSQRPGDIIKSLSGQTIEILNTDAEGRLVLADILTYIQGKFNPRQIIDIATLTGAIMIALGTHRAGLFSNDDVLSSKLEKSGDITGEKIWRLPIGPEYDAEIDSSRSDMKNIGSSRYGGSIHAAQFIKRFVNKDTPWAHIDIAGVSWTMKAGKNSFSKLHSPGATAFGVRLIDDFLKGH